MIKAVVFDLDGTLIESRDAICMCFNHALESHGLEKVDCAELSKTIGVPLEKQIPLYVPKEKLYLAPELCKSHRAMMLERGMGMLMVFPGVMETLEALRPLKLGIATSKSSINAGPILERLGLIRFFDAVVCNDMVPTPKPSPEMLQKAMGILEVSPEEALYVGDAGVDIQMAKAAGAKSCAAMYGYGSEEELRDADFKISSFPELKAIVF